MMSLQDRRAALRGLGEHDVILRPKGATEGAQESTSSSTTPDLAAA
jgi:hypothetical protein